MATEAKYKIYNGSSWDELTFTPSSHTHSQYLTSSSSVKEAYLSWGGKNFSGSYGCIDAAMIPALGANRLAFMPAAGVTVEYSQDGGSTWSTYSTTDAAKINLFNGNGNNYYIGGSTATKIDKSTYMVRVTIETSTAQVYTALNKFAILVSTGGSSGCYCTITGRTQTNYAAGTDTWATFANKVSVAGWSGWNIINTSSITTYGNSANQYRQLRFTFGVTSHASTVAYAGLTISKILGFGGVGWTTPSTMAATGNMYTYDYAKNVTFPAAVKATSFYEDGTALSSKYAAASHTHSQYLTEHQSLANTIKALSISGKTITYTKGDGTTGTLTTQDTNTTYSAGTGLSLSSTTFSVKYGTTVGTACQGNDSRLSDSRNAKDVYSWAKASTKPSYSWSEITGKPNILDGQTVSTVADLSSYGATDLISAPALLNSLDYFAANDHDHDDTYAAKSHTHSSITRLDTRSVNSTPYADYNGQVSWHLKNNTTIGIMGEGTYSGLLQLTPWDNNTGGSSHQLAFGTSGGIYHRYGTSTYGSWKRLIEVEDTILEMNTVNTGDLYAANNYIHMYQDSNGVPKIEIIEPQTGQTVIDIGTNLVSISNDAYYTKICPGSIGLGFEGDEIPLFYFSAEDGINISESSYFSNSGETYFYGDIYAGPDDKCIIHIDPNNGSVTGDYNIIYISDYLKSNGYKYTFPSKSGTIALTSDITAAGGATVTDITSHFDTDSDMYEADLAAGGVTTGYIGCQGEQVALVEGNTLRFHLWCSSSYPTQQNLVIDVVMGYAGTDRLIGRGNGFTLRSTYSYQSILVEIIADHDSGNLDVTFNTYALGATSSAARSVYKIRKVELIA